jgi:hypothetical protein
MSLAMYAAPFNDNSNNTNNSMDESQDNLISKKRQSHNKTQKRYPKENFDTQKVNSVLETIHNNSTTDDDNNLGDFNPPPMPDSAGVNKTTATEAGMNMSNEKNDLMFRTLGRAPQPNYVGGDNLDLNDYKLYGDSKTTEEYYKKVLPGGYTPNRNPVNRPYYNTIRDPMDGNSSANNPDILLQKLNYMINLLEDQQDERTNNVTEEVVLYSFLGIFIIFVVDSFAKVGKYIR